MMDQHRPVMSPSPFSASYGGTKSIFIEDLSAHTSTSLWVWIENLHVNSRVVARTCHGLSGFIRVVGLQIVHELHGGGVRCQLQHPLTAGLQLEGDVDGPVNGKAQAVDADLPVATSF